jgi:hypothetical protein
MVKAINKEGVVGNFSDIAWRLLGKNKNGWTEWNGLEKVINVPKEIIEFQAKKKEAAAVIKSEPTEEEMKAWLTENNIKFHFKLGHDKLKALYDDSRKPQNT